MPCWRLFARCLVKLESGAAHFYHMENYRAVLTSYSKRISPTVGLFEGHQLETLYYRFYEKMPLSGAVEFTEKDALPGAQ